MPRGNPQNLKPMNKMTVEEQKKIASKGGKVSGESRRKRKTLREDLLALLSAGNTQNDMNLALIQRAMSGDTKAYEVVRDTIGEKPVEKVMLAEVDKTVIDEVEQMMKED